MTRSDQLQQNYDDARLANRSNFPMANDKVGGLDIRGKEDSNFSHSVHSRKIVKNYDHRKCALSGEYF